LRVFRRLVSGTAVSPFSTSAERFLSTRQAVAALKTAHLPKITLSFEFSVLALTAPGLRLRKVQNTLCF
jgi:hypothetical protein